MSHQLATLSGHPESGECRRVLYGLVGSVPSLIDGDVARFLSFFNRGLRWHQLFFEQFPDWVSDESMVVITDLDRFERASLRLEPAPASRTALPYVVVEGTAAGREIDATALIRSQLPELTADTFDIHPNTLEADELVPSLDRSRRVFTLLVDGRLKAVALCETGTRNASLFHLLTMAQLYFCLDGEAPLAEEQFVLLARVRQFYGERGVRDPIILSPSGNSALAQEPGTRLAEAMGCIAVSGTGLRQWENFCKFFMGQLYQRRPGVLSEEQSV